MSTENSNDSNIDFFEMKKDGKINVTENKAKWLFIRNYTIIALICYIIYKLSNYIMQQNFHRFFTDNFAFVSEKIQNIVEYTELYINKSSIIMMSFTIIILCNFLVVILSSFLFFKKYTVKKEYINSIMKVVIITEIVFSLFLVFDSGVSYINFNESQDTIEFYETIIENDSNKYGKIDYNIRDYFDKINTTNLINYIIIIVINICCSILCIIIQKKILERDT